MSSKVIQAKRIALAALFALLLLLAATACGGGSNSQIVVKIAVTRYLPTKIHSGGHTYVRPRPTHESFTLACEPVSGSLPFASRVCRDIALHRQAMLAPGQPRSVCGGSPFMATVQVEVVRGVKDGGFSASPGCGWPGGTPASIYFAATTHDARALKLIDPRLRCEDNPAFFAKPTPWASIVACTRGLWTRSAESTIRAAKQTRVLGSLTKAFPNDPGVVRCRIRTGGPQPPNGPHFIGGLCGVSLSGPPSQKLVHFTEAWNIGKRVLRHRWTMSGKTLIGQSGPLPPQEAI